MKDNQRSLKIFNFSHSLFKTEWLSLFSDKYSSALPFKLEVVDSPAKAQVILWDGIITAKNKVYADQLVNEASGAMFLFLGESVTLAQSNPQIELMDRKSVEHVEISGWNVLPEDMLGALLSCYQKLNHV
jgi:Ni,Fe-hydrogenase III small subunit